MAAEQGVVEELHVRHDVERELEALVVNLEEPLGLFVDGAVLPHHAARLADIPEVAALAPQRALFDLLALFDPVLRLYGPSLADTHRAS